MSFISVDFALFVTAVLLLYYLFPKRYRWVLLLIASYVFYGLTGIGNFAYILVTTVSAYFGALLIENKGAEQKKYLEDNK